MSSTLTVITDAEEEPPEFELALEELYQVSALSVCACSVVGRTEDDVLVPKAKERARTARRRCRTQRRRQTQSETRRSSAGSWLSTGPSI